MALTQAQKQALAADLQATQTPEVLAWIAQNSVGLIADWYNAPADPAYIVWKTSLQLEEITSNGFDWVRVDNLSVGKARIWEWMFGSEDKSINPSKANIRAGIAEVWKGTAADLAVQASVLAHCKRPASRVEKLFATGPGTTAEPALLVFEGLIHWQDVVDALAAEV
jgi:hypothetical protein